MQHQHSQHMIQPVWYHPHYVYHPQQQQQVHPHYYEQYRAYVQAAQHAYMQQQQHQQQQLNQHQQLNEQQHKQAAVLLRKIQLQHKVKQLSESEVKTIDITLEPKVEPKVEPSVPCVVGKRKVCISDTYEEAVKALKAFNLDEMDEAPKTKLYIEVDQLDAFVSGEFRLVDVPSIADTSKLHRMIIGRCDAFDTMFKLYGKSFVGCMNTLTHAEDKLNLVVSTNKFNPRSRLCLTGRGVLRLCQQFLCVDNADIVLDLLKIVPELVYSFEAVPKPE